MNSLERLRLEKLLQVAESDLRDCKNPEVLKQWPNLGTPESIEAAEARIRQLKAQLDS